ncbi:MAG: glycosyltransferase [Akkermansiaceae bacterium]
MNEKPKRNFLLIVDSLLGGGAERMVLTLAKALSSAGHQAVVLNLSGQTELNIPEGICVINRGFNISSRHVRRHGDEFSRCIAEIESQVGEFDGIIGNLPLAEAFLHRSSRDSVFVIHCVLSHHVNSKRGLLKRIRKRLSYKSRYKQRRLICCSEAVRKDLIENFSIRPQQCITIHNPVDVNWIRQQTGVDSPGDLPRGDYIIHVGSFSEVKRHDLLVEAFALSGVDGDLVLVGQGPEERAIRQLVNEMGMAEKVHFLGFKQNPYPYMKHARLLALSSDSEALPTVLIEALACETPVVSTDTPGAKEILAGDLARGLCAVGDVHALAEKLHQAWESKGEAEYLKAIEAYTMHFAAKKYVDFMLKKKG